MNCKKPVLLKQKPIESPSACPHCLNPSHFIALEAQNVYRWSQKFNLASNDNRSDTAIQRPFTLKAGAHLLNKKIQIGSYLVCIGQLKVEIPSKSLQQNQKCFGHYYFKLNNIFQDVTPEKIIEERYIKDESTQTNVLLNERNNPLPWKTTWNLVQKFAGENKKNKNRQN